MAYTYIQNFEGAQTPVGQKVNTDRQGSGGDGVYSITQYAGLPYSGREVYIEGNITHSGNRSLKHVFSRSSGSGEYTNAEAHISPTSQGENPTNGSESWSRMFVYLDSNFDWRTGSGGNSISTEPKFFRTWYFSNRWVNSHLRICKRSGPHGDAFEALGYAIEVVHKTSGMSVQEPWQPGLFNQPNSSLIYRAPFDNEYALYKLPKGRWFTVETYMKWDTAANGGGTMLWLDGTLLYHFGGDLNTSSLDTRGAPNGVIGIMTEATWGGLPYSNGNVMYTDDYIITNDRSYVEANGEQDKFGNWMVGGSKTSNGGENGDANGPVITNISTQTKETSATITWDTDEKSNSVVDYGSTEDRGTLVYGNEDTRKHVVELTDLEVDTQYYYRLSSKDASGNVTLIRENRTFTTGSQPEPGEVALNDLTDVSLSSLSKGQILVYDGTQWVNRGINLDSMIENKVVEVLERAKIVVT